jgi:mevalonate pyrophosphate decarboxylase
MSNLDSRCEKCERDIQQLRIQFDTLRSEMIEVVGRMLTRVDEILVKVQTYNEQMFADLQAQTDAGFASLRACIDAASRTERKDDEPPKLN